MTRTPPIRNGRPAGCGGERTSRRDSRRCIRRALCGTALPTARDAAAFRSRTPKPRRPPHEGGSPEFGHGERLPRIDEVGITYLIPVRREDVGVAEPRAIGATSQSPKIVSGLHDDPAFRDRAGRQDGALERHLDPGGNLAARRQLVDAQPVAVRRPCSPAVSAASVLADPRWRHPPARYRHTRGPARPGGRCRRSGCRRHRHNRRCPDPAGRLAGPPPP